MRKRRLSLLLVLCMLAMLLSACTQNKKVNTEDAADTGCSVYYLNQDLTEIGAVKVNSITLSGNTEADIDVLIRQLAAAPDSVGYRAILGHGVTLKNYSVSSGSLVMNFGSDYLKMSKTEEVLFRASLVQTLTQVKTVKYVMFNVDGSTLLDDNGEPVGIMRSSSFIDDTGTEINSYSKAKLKLYFTDRQGQHLIETDEDVVYSSNMSLEKLVVEKLIEGPQTDDVYPTIAPDTKLLSVTVKDSICYVNFDAGLADKPYDVAENVVIYSIVDSLSELMDVDKVQILIEGRSDRVLFSKMSLDNIYESDLDLLAVPESGKEK